MKIRTKVIGTTVAVGLLLTGTVGSALAQGPAWQADNPRANPMESPAPGRGHGFVDEDGDGVNDRYDEDCDGIPDTDQAGYGYGFVDEDGDGVNDRYDEDCDGIPDGDGTYGRHGRR